MNNNLQGHRVAMTILLGLLCTMGLTKAYAYDFYAACPTGQILYYNIIDYDNHYVEITYPAWNYSTQNVDWDSYQKPSGLITLPATVTKNGITYTVTKIGTFSFINCIGLLGDLVIPNTVNTIGEYAFTACSGFDGTLTLPNSVTTIEHAAFSGCSSLSGTVVIPESVTSLGPEAFLSCIGISGVVLPNSITSIRSGTFNNCSGITSVTLPESLLEIGSKAFYHCISLTGELVIPNAVTTIGDEAFCLCENLTGTLVVGKSVTEIGTNAFQHCERITHLVLPNTLTSIGSGAFYFCLNLTGDLVFPNSLTFIGQNSFWACDLTSVTIPSALSTFYEGIFAYNDNMTTVNYNATSAELLTSNTNSNTYHSVFDGCDALTTFNIGVNVTSIPEMLLRRTSWSSGVNNLSVINCYAPAPPKAEENTFVSVPANVTVNVPSCSLEEYQDADPWSQFTHWQATLPCFSIFTGDGSNTLWSNPANWSEYPSENGDVAILAECILDVDNVTVNDAMINMGRLTIPSGKKLTVLGEMTNYGTADHLFILDGGQLLHHSDGVQATVTKTLSNYDTEDNGWHLMASPVSDAVAVSSVQNLTNNGYDLYSYDEPTQLWVNQKDEEGFNTLEPHKGYLYANSGSVLFDFDEDLEGWTTIDANDDGFDWMHSQDYSIIQSAQVDQQGHNASYGFAVSESYVNHRSHDPESVWYNYDDGTMVDYIGTNGGTFSWGIMLPAGSFSEPFLYQVSVYDVMAMTGTLTIYNDGTDTPSSPIASMNITFSGTGGFRYYTFQNPVPIDPNKNVWVVFYNSSGATFPAAVSADSGDANGRWISLDGSNWNDLASYGLNYTFMVRAHFAYSNFSVIPDNYLVSPQVEFHDNSRLSFWATDGNNSYGNEYFGVAVSTTGNTEASDFTTVATWSFNFSKSMAQSRQLSDGVWYNLSVDLGAYAGQTGYVAIRHFNCADQWLLCVDDVMFENIDVVGFETESLMQPVTLAFAGTLENGAATVSVPLSHTGVAVAAGFNLVGNPFAHDVTAYSGTNIAAECYRMNRAGDGVVVSTVSAAHPLKPAEGFFVKALAQGATVTFNPSAKGTATKQSYINLEISENDCLVDRLIVKREGKPLEKLTLGQRGTKIFATQNGQEWAVVATESTAQAVSFTTDKSGTFTLSVQAEGQGWDYLHLIDRLTGADIDLLASPTYTFTANANDNASRFRLVFSGNADANDKD